VASADKGRFFLFCGDERSELGLDTLSRQRIILGEMENNTG
jgi:hypothetical protein